MPRIDSFFESGKYKNKTILEVFEIDPSYLEKLLIESDCLGPKETFLRDDFPFDEMKEHGYIPSQAVINAYKKREEEIERIKNMSPVEEILNFGKYKEKTILEVFKIDPSYLNWVLINTDQLGPCELCTRGYQYDFPFEEMKKHGYFPPKEVIDAYSKREKEIESEMRSAMHDEEEQGFQSILDEQDDEFWEEMGEEGYWNLD